MLMSLVLLMLMLVFLFVYVGDDVNGVGFDLECAIDVVGDADVVDVM